MMLTSGKFLPSKQVTNALRWCWKGNEVKSPESWEINPPQGKDISLEQKKAKPLFLASKKSGRTQTHTTTFTKQSLGTQLYSSLENVTNQRKGQKLALSM